MRCRSVLLVLTTALVGAGVPAAHAAERCVGPPAGCHHTLQAALDASLDGDLIRIKAGTFAGGAIVTTSVTIAGAGQHKTILKGGGPVLAIGEMFDETPPTVTVRDLTLTGGRTTTSPQSREFFDQDGVEADGGGIAIPPGADFAPGATVSVTRVRIAGNRAAPTTTIESGLDCGEICPFAGAFGGGIDSWGNLTVTDSTVTDNRVGSSGASSVASDAEGAGIRALIGTLTILRSAITHNRSVVVPPLGRFATGGGVFYPGGPAAVIKDSVIADNRAEAGTAFASEVPIGAVGGGVLIPGGAGSGEITRTAITGNSLSMTNSVGDVFVFSGGMHVDSGVEFSITDSLVAGNRVSAERTAATPGFTHGDGGGGQLFGTMTRTRVLGNTVTATAPAGDVEALAGGTWSQFGDIRSSQFAANQLRASSRDGNATVRGAGVVADTDPEDQDPTGLNLTGSQVTANVGVARGGETSTGQGGGIFDAALELGPFGAPLALTNSAVTHNVLLGRRGATLQGGGVYLAGHPISRTGSLIARNHPDQCFGCDSTATRRSALLNAARAATAHDRRLHATPLIGRLRQTGR